MQIETAVSETAVSETYFSVKYFTMQFYNREKEIARLKEIQKQSGISAQFTVITGRRRIGKTQLLLHAVSGQPTLYFFVARKAESFL